MRIVAEPGLDIHLGDAAEILPTLPESSVDCVVTSPPYFGLRDYAAGEWEGGDPACSHERPNPTRGSSTLLGGKSILDLNNRGVTAMSNCPLCGAHRVDAPLGQEPDPELYIAHLVQILDELPRVLAPPGTLWLNLADTWRGEALGIPWRVALALRETGWRIVSDVIWHKINALPESQSARPSKTHEHVFLLTRGDRHFYSPRKDQPRVRDVWALPIASSSSSSGHGATFPERLAATCIRLGCPPGGTVLDPFFGLGTTALAARRLGRSCIGIELERRWADLAAERLGTLTLAAE